MAVPTVLYCPETWVVTKYDLSKIKASKMNFVRQVKGCKREYRFRNEDILSEL